MGFRLQEFGLLIPRLWMEGLKPNELYPANHNNNTSNEDNEKNFDETINETQGWGENGATIELINITTITNDTGTTRTDVEGKSNYQNIMWKSLQVLVS
jgi:hypothetical protein